MLGRPHIPRLRPPIQSRPYTPDKPLSSFTVSAPARGCIYYGRSKRSVGVDQAKTVIVTIAIEAAPVRNANSHRSAIIPQGSCWRVSPRCGWFWRRWAFGAPRDGVDSTIIGCGASSWWSSRHHSPHGGELGCEDEVRRSVPRPHSRHTVMSIPVRRSITACGVSGSRGSGVGCASRVRHRESLRARARLASTP